MNGFRKKLYVSQDVDCEYEIEFEKLLEIIQNCSEVEKAEIKGMVSDHKKSRSKILYTKQDIDCEYDVEFDDLLDLVECCNPFEMKLIQEIVVDNDQEIVCKTIYDEEKLKVLKAAFNKYELEELISRLEIKYY